MKSVLRLATMGSVISLAIILCRPALAQYTGGGAGGNTGGVYTPLQGGYKTSTGIAVGATAAAGVAVGYLVAESAEGLELKNDKNKVPYEIVGGGQGLVPGRRVKVKGKKVMRDGKQAFRVKSFKDLGPCSESHIRANSTQ
jgi:hypothetical protein